MPWVSLCPTSLWLSSRRASSGRLLTAKPVQPLRLGIPGAPGGRMCPGPGLGPLQVGQEAGAGRPLCSCQA